MAFKERKLMPKEKEKLRELKREARDRQAAFTLAVDKLESDKSEIVATAIRNATNTAKEANEVFRQEKRKVDKWKEARLRNVEHVYQKKLKDIRAAKSEICQRAEADIETVRADQDRYIEKERKRLDGELAEFLQENKLAQENIRFGPPDQRKELKPTTKKKQATTQSVPA